MEINLSDNKEDWSEYRPTEFLYRQGGKWIDNWFSNMVPSPIVHNGLTYPSLENFYQAHKAKFDADHEKIRLATPSQAKHLGRTCDMREDWEKIKVIVMYAGLFKKFSQPFWKDKLLATKDVLIEWNNWGDTYWGVSSTSNKGKNVLGILLMKIRNELSSIDNLAKPLDFKDMGYQI